MRPSNLMKSVVGVSWVLIYILVPLGTFQYSADETLFQVWVAIMYALISFPLFWLLYYNALYGYTPFKPEKIKPEHSKQFKIILIITFFVYTASSSIAAFYSIPRF